jgi:hypothetical protein
MGGERGLREGDVRWRTGEEEKRVGSIVSLPSMNGVHTKWWGGAAAECND